MNQVSSGIATAVAVTLPEWVPGVVDAFPACTNDTGRMRLAIMLARENVERGSGGPFGAAIFARGAPRPLAVGVNCEPVNLSPACCARRFAAAPALRCAKTAVIWFTKFPCFRAARLGSLANRRSRDGRRKIHRLCVERLRNAVLHAEIVALMLAEARLGSYTLRAPDAPEYELFTSCTPCAMCLGATLWSGVRRIVCAAGREDAMALGFDEGPVFPESWRYLEAQGIALEHGLLAAQAAEVMRRYREGNGLVYNG